MYNTKVMKVFENLKNVGTMKGQDNVSHVLYGSVDSHLVVSFDVKVEDNVVSKALFKAYGNPTVIAVAEFLCSYVIGKSLDNVNQDLDVNLILNYFHENDKPIDITVAYAMLTAMNKALVYKG